MELSLHLDAQPSDPELERRRRSCGGATSSRTDVRRRRGRGRVVETVGGCGAGGRGLVVQTAGGGDEEREGARRSQRRGRDKRERVEPVGAVGMRCP
jgi:hypothetical protein